MRTFENKHYNPADYEIQDRARQSGLKKYSPTFVADIAAYFAGEKPRKITDLQKELESLPDPKPVEKFDSAGDPYYQMSPGKGTTRSRKNAIKDLKEFRQEKLLRLQKFVQGLPKNIPGITPLDKAAAVVKKLSQACSECAGKNPGGGGGDPLDSLPIWANKENHMEEHLNEIQDAADAVENMSQEDWDMVDGSDPEEVFASMREETLKILQMDQYMNLRTNIRTKPKAKLEAHPDGDEVFHDFSSSIADLGEIDNQKKVLMSRNVGYAMMQGEGTIPQNFRRQNSMPFICEIIDRSGSMRNTKQWMALGILYNLCKEVERGNTQALVAFYEKELLHDPVYLHKEMQPLKWFAEFAKKQDFNKDNTQVGVAAQQMLQAYEELVTEGEAKDLMIDSSQQHLVVIHDGQDSVGSFTVEDLNGAKLHSFMLWQDHEDLKQISLESGGEYHLIEAEEEEGY